MLKQHSHVSLTEVANPLVSFLETELSNFEQRAIRRIRLFSGTSHRQSEDFRQKLFFSCRRNIAHWVNQAMVYRVKAVA